MDPSGDKAPANDLIPVVYEYLRDTCSEAADALKKRFKKVSSLHFVPTGSFLLCGMISQWASPGTRGSFSVLPVVYNYSSVLMITTY